MKNVFGNNLSITLFGESHGAAIGAVLDGLAPGMEVDCSFIEKMLSMRRPSGEISTARQEKDNFEILSGVFENKTTGTPLCIVIKNQDTRSKDYSDTKDLARPSHADYTALCKYHGYADYRGGGHFSGRITAALVAAGAIVIPALTKKGIKIATHIANLSGIADRAFDNMENDISTLNNADFAVLDSTKAEQMKDAIKAAKADGDSIGGILETVICGLPQGLGEPWFDTVEGLISHALFSIPAIKGIEFGAGFDFANMKGSDANDAFCMRDGKVATATNNAGGINGGITNGMPIVLRCAVRPTPTIAKEQNTVNMKTNSETTISAKGRHDPCIVHRARVVVDAVCALVVADMLATRFGTDWLGE